MAFFESPNVVKKVVNGVCMAAKVLGVGLGGNRKEVGPYFCTNLFLMQNLRLSKLYS